MTNTVTALPRDYSVTAPDRHTQYLNVYDYDILMDEAGDTLVDEAGDTLVSDIYATPHNIYTVHAPARDYSVTVPEESNG